MWCKRNKNLTTKWLWWDSKAIPFSFLSELLFVLYKAPLLLWCSRTTIGTSNCAFLSIAVLWSSFLLFLFVKLESILSCEIKDVAFRNGACCRRTFGLFVRKEPFLGFCEPLLLLTPVLDVVIDRRRSPEEESNSLLCCVVPSFAIPVPMNLSSGIFADCLICNFREN